MEMYVISKDKPKEQKLLHDEIEKAFGKSLPFISDPELQLIDEVGMKNGDVAYRGYAIIAPDGKVVLKQVNDNWGLESIKQWKILKRRMIYCKDYSKSRSPYKGQAWTIE